MSESPSSPLIDRFGRVHDSLRLSVTDRCNIRCFYCMPEQDAQFAPRDWLLTFEEITRLTRLLVERCGIKDVRITGGEPLVRKELDSLIGMLAEIGLGDLSLTSNGILLAEQAALLRQAGLRRINISLDTLDPTQFRKITRRDGLERTIEGIDAAIACGFESIKLNTLAIRNITEPEVIRLLEFALERGVELRFIEFMPLDTDRAWRREQVLTGDDLLRIVEARFGPVNPLGRRDAAQPAESFSLGRDGRFGIIRSVTRPFCGNCNRLRITADGSLRNCLFARTELPLRDRLRSGASDDEIVADVVRCVAAKAAAHGIDDADFSPPDRPMYAIGG